MPKSTLSPALFVAITIAALVPTARADDLLTGDWRGDYICAQGATGLTLTVLPGLGERVDAIFRFSALPSNPSVPDGCFEMTGTVKDGAVSLTAGRWLLKPPGYVTVDLKGKVTDDAMGGTVAGPGCTTFSLHRGQSDGQGVPAPCRGPALVASSAR
jgi:hypothetical protein